MKFYMLERVPHEVKYLSADCGVRYWENAEVNGETDHNGDKIPFRVGDVWKLIIELETGQILNWPKGIEATINYKVCDAGIYRLLNENFETVVEQDGYVPSMLCPKCEGYGDYIIMDIDRDGFIQGWNPDFSYFDDRYLI